MNLKEKRELAQKEREEFAYYLKGHRESLGLNIVDFASRLGIDYRTYSRYEGAMQLPKRMDEFILNLREVVKANRP